MKKLKIYLNSKKLCLEFLKVFFIFHFPTKSEKLIKKGKFIAFAYFVSQRLVLLVYKQIKNLRKS